MSSTGNNPLPPFHLFLNAESNILWEIEYAWVGSFWYSAWSRLISSMMIELPVPMIIRFCLWPSLQITGPNVSAGLGSGILGVR